MNQMQHDGMAPIHIAVVSGNLEAVKCLMEREDIKPDEPGWEGRQLASSSTGPKIKFSALLEIPNNQSFQMSKSLTRILNS